MSEHKQKPGRIDKRGEVLYTTTTLIPHCTLNQSQNKPAISSGNLSGSQIKTASGDGSKKSKLTILETQNEHSLREAYSSMDTGAYIYIELMVEFYFRADRVIKTLKSIGFDDLHIYLPKPDPSISTPHLFIPIDAPGALGYVVQNSNKAQRENVIVKTARLFRRLLWRIAPRSFTIFPWLLSSGMGKFTICILARKPLKQNSNNPNHNNLFDIIKSNWKELETGESPERISSIAICRGEMGYEKVILLVFKDRLPKPQFVIKIALTKKALSTYSNEESVLKVLNGMTNPIAGVPGLPFSKHYLGTQIFCQTYMSEAPLKNILNTANFNSVARAATEWLINLANKTKKTPPPDWKNIYVQNPIADIKHALGQELGKDTIELTQSLLDQFEVPMMVCEHGDFSPLNINMGTGDYIEALDWEGSRIWGIPVLDLHFFLTRCVIDFKLEPGYGSVRKRYRQMLDPNTTTGAIYHSCIKHYSSDLGISESYLRHFSLLTWIYKVHKRLFDYESGTLIQNSPISDDLRFFINLWEEELVLTKERGV